MWCFRKIKTLIFFLYCTFNLVNVQTQAKYVNSSNVWVVHNCPFTALTLWAFLEFGLVWDEQCPSFSNPWEWLQTQKAWLILYYLRLCWNRLIFFMHEWNLVGTSSLWSSWLEEECCLHQPVCETSFWRVHVGCLAYSGCSAVPSNCKDNTL